ncbi:MAG: hypothetical protein AVDCRST_MAG64-3021, partial [uncultured Phycisphaerae bacterium]
APRHPWDRFRTVRRRRLRLSRRGAGGSAHRRRPARAGRDGVVGAV